MLGIDKIVLLLRYQIIKSVTMYLKKMKQIMSLYDFGVIKEKEDFNQGENILRSNSRNGCSSYT